MAHKLDDPLQSQVGVRGPVIWLQSRMQHLVLGMYRTLRLSLLRFVLTDLCWC